MIPTVEISIEDAYGKDWQRRIPGDKEFDRFTKTAKAGESWVTYVGRIQTLRSDYAEGLPIMVLRDKFLPKAWLRVHRDGPLGGELRERLLTDEETVSLARLGISV